MAIIIGLAAVLFTALGGLFALKFRDKLHLILGFSAGAVVAVALFELLPESFTLTAGVHSIQTISIIIAAGFSVSMLLDRFFSIHPQSDSHCDNPHHHPNKFGVSALAVHSLIDGLSIGLAMKVSPEVGAVVAVAVLAHKFSDGINTVSMTMIDGDNKKETLKWLAINALAPIIGIAGAAYVTITEANLGVILAVFAGLFLYLGASELIPESHHRHPKFATTLMTILGMAVIFAATYLGE